MAKRGGFFLVLGLVFALSDVALAAEKWKGPLSSKMFTIGGLAGAGVLDSEVGFATLGVAAVKVMDRGFVGEDLNNQLFIEGVFGPLFLRSYAFAQWGLHLRWDWHLDEFWTLYSVGGIGGVFGHTRAIFYPRFGIGAVWNVFAQFGIRAELSHEFTGLGVVVQL